MQIVLQRGDITDQDVDVVVNAANSSLLGGGGVDGAIHRRGGPAGRLPARWVIHTVGPVYSRDDDRSELLASAYRESLRVADEFEARSVAFPAISAGMYGWPLDDAARIAIETVRSAATSVHEVRFVLFGQTAYDAFDRALARD